MAITVESESAGEAWEESIRSIVKNADTLLDSDVGGPFYEVQNAVITVQSPLTDPVVSRFYAFPELIPTFEISRSARSLEARTIFERIRHWQADESRFIDQLDTVVSALQRNLFSRRAVVTMWNPLIDPREPIAICPCFFQLLVRPGQDGDPVVQATVVVRSSDAWMGAMCDIWAFTRLQKYVADALGLGVGPYVHHVVSYHLYQQDLGAVRTLMRRA